MAIEHSDAQDVASPMIGYKRIDLDKRLKAEQGIENLLRYLGEDLDREGLFGTPQRVVKAFRELCEGYRSEDKPEQILSKTFDHDMDQMILVRDIEFVSLCEHHMLPFQGTATVAYIPSGRVVGLSKLSRVVHYYARRLQIQERMTQQIADAIMTYIKPSPIGSGCILSAHHSCMSLRGSRSTGQMITSVIRGAFLTNSQIKDEFLSLAGR